MSAACSSVLRCARSGGDRAGRTINTTGRPRQLPVFCELGLVHFPHAPLTLHLHEERYRVLARRVTGAVRAADVAAQTHLCRFIVVAEFEGDAKSVPAASGTAHAAHGSDGALSDLIVHQQAVARAIRQRVGCLCEMRLAHETTDGRWFIKARGVHRVRVLDASVEPDTNGLIYAAVEELIDAADRNHGGAPRGAGVEAGGGNGGDASHDDDGDDDDADVHATFAADSVSDTLADNAYSQEAMEQETAQRNRQRVAMISQLLREYLDGALWARVDVISIALGLQRRVADVMPEDPLRCSYWVAMMLPLGALEKQHLLAAPTVRERLEAEAAFLRRLIADDRRLRARLVSGLVVLVAIVLLLLLHSVVARAA